MATITTDTYLDGGTARTAGEAWTINGGILTIRTDTRWHANAPAGMLGSIGATTTSATLGGGVLIDARNVRWLAYNSGGGVVPAIGTTITQGGVSGYLLGVYADLASAPTAVGAAVPSTGFIKFREVTSGPFASGALTGITATATGADVAGWIEVVQDQAVANTVPRLGSFKVRGTWFYLDNTNGSAGQQIQIPTNGGGSGTRVPAVWIETGVGTNVFEQFPAVSSTYFNTTNLGTDTRSKFVLMDAGGIVRVGGDGTSSIGFLPPSGCRVRIPNVLGRQTSAANRALNLVPHATLASRPDFTTTSAGDIDFEYFLNDWYHLFASAYKVRMVHSATMDIHSSSNEASGTDLNDYCTGVYQAASIPLTLTNNSLGGTIADCKFFRPDAASNGHPVSLTGCVGHTFTDVHAGVLTYARSTGRITASQCRNLTFSGLYAYAAPISLVTCQNVNVTNYDVIDRIVGTTNATTGAYGINLSTSCDKITFDGIRFGLNSTIADIHPYLGVANASNCSNLTFRNGGTFASPLGGSTNAPAYIWADSGNNDTVRVQRIYLTATRTNLFLSVNTSKNVTLEDCGGTVGAIQTLSVNTQARGIRAASNSVTAGSSVYGSHWFDMFLTDTTGRIWLAFNEPTTFSDDYYQAVSLGAGAGFTSGGQISMPNLGDQIIFEMPYYVLGHTALANVAPTLTGTNTGNFTYEYQIDVNDGNGWNGTWKTLNATNLSGESVAATGFKLKYRITVATASATNALTYIRIDTVSTAVAQAANLFPLDYATVTLTGLISGSRVQIWDDTNDVEVYNDVVSSTTLVYATPYVADFSARVRVKYTDATTSYYLVEFTETVTVLGLTRSIAQEADPVYAANGVNGATVADIAIVDSTQTIEVDTGAITWAQIYAYAKWWLAQEDGIRDYAVIMTATDTANYAIGETFQVKNVTSPTEPLIITGGYCVDADTGEAIDILDNTGGTIYCAPPHVVPFESGGGGLTVNDILNGTIETGFTLKEVLQILAAVAAGKTTITDLGGGAATVVFRDVTDSRDAVTASMTDSERDSVTIT